MLALHIYLSNILANDSQRYHNYGQHETDQIADYPILGSFNDRDDHSHKEKHRHDKTQSCDDPEWLDA